MKKESTKTNFLDYNTFPNVDIAYLVLIKRILSVVDNIVHFKDIRINSNTQDWFDDKVVEAIKLRGQLLKHLK